MKTIDLFYLALTKVLGIFSNWKNKRQFTMYFSQKFKGQRKIWQQFSNNFFSSKWWEFFFYLLNYITSMFGALIKPQDKLLNSRYLKLSYLELTTSLKYTNFFCHKHHVSSFNFFFLLKQLSNGWILLNKKLIN